ncbi:cytochrome P450 monooxygenase [Pyrenophora seminiperda CCB06]|uniref:Cytochrome P450 monooxygenase n=1 Tax=Pyrenophora seminiperda CCB06 TaxID=1302712 RepID=A0A3M7LVG7_9PLEO|nr:cytochrome P450 monooxygenase [Pyrenophora seminiperda CCB06]
MSYEYLMIVHPIRRNTNKTPIPTCPYKFPDGQGDIAKFLEGERNSEGWAKEHGHIYRIWSGRTPEIVLTRPEDIKQVFRDSNTHLKASNNNAGWLMGEVLGSCLGLVSGEEWQDIRLATAASFTHGEVVDRLEQVERLTMDHFAQLHCHGKLSDNVINPVQDLRMLPFWIVADHIYGPLDSHARLELEALIPLRESLFARVIQGGATRFAWSRILPTKTNSDLREFKQRWHEWNDAVAHKAQNSQPEAPIVTMFRAVRQGKISPESLYQTLDEMLFANLDVTMGAISWNLMFLAANPDTQDQIRDEITAARAAKDGKLWKEYLRSPSTLLAYSILESARLKPLAAFTVPQAAPIAHEIAGYCIPPRTNYIIDTYAINQRNAFWGEDTETYRPQRFLHHSKSDIRYQYWRFGFGPRQCLGKHLAEMMIRCLLVHLLENYKLSMRKDSRWEKNPDTWIMHPMTELRCERL